MSSSETFARQPSTHWNVIEAQAEPRQNHTRHTHEQGGLPCFGKRVLLCFHQPQIEDIHQRIMHDIERERQVAQKLAYTCAQTVGGRARSGNPHKYGKDADDAHRLKNAIPAHPQYKAHGTVSAVQVYTTRKLRAPSRDEKYARETFPE